MNRADFIGRLTKHPEVGETASGVNFAKFSIAVDRKFKNADGEKETDFFNCIAWRKLAEIIGDYAKKGSQVYVSGELQNHSYEGSDGVSRTAMQVVVNDFQLLGSKQENNTELKPVDVDEELPF